MLSAELEAKLKWLSCCAYFGIVLCLLNLVLACLIPFNLSIVLMLAAGLGAVGIVWGATADHEGLLVWSFWATPIVALLFLVNYIVLAESIDLDKYSISTEDSLEQHAETDPMDNFIIKASMFVDLGLIVECFALMNALYNVTRLQRERWPEVVRGDSFFMSFCPRTLQRSTSCESPRASGSWRWSRSLSFNEEPKQGEHVVHFSTSANREKPSKGKASSTLLSSLARRMM
mmetsp:Transcript_30876/g.51091  ORF Transcript_30876/g.51091 Transcript_30876/m.51091 type:complete len:231 (+) Transcript_30876:180-872(+)